MGQQAILNAAARIIRSQGVMGMTVARVVRESGTSAGAIYHHFPNKQAVVMAVARNAIQVPVRALLDYRATPSSPQEVLAFALFALRADRELSDLLVQLGAGAASDDSLGRELREAFGVLRDEVETTLNLWADQEGVDPARVPDLAQLVVGLTLGFAAQRNLLRSFDEDAYFASATSLLAVDHDVATS